MATGTGERVVKKEPNVTPCSPNYRKVRIVVSGPRTTQPVCLVNQFCRQGYLPRYPPNIGVDFNIHSIRIDEVIVRLQLMPFEEYRITAFFKRISRRAHGAV